MTINSLWIHQNMFYHIRFVNTIKIFFSDRFLKKIKCEKNKYKWTIIAEEVYNTDKYLRIYRRLYKQFKEQRREREKECDLNE